MTGNKMSAAMQRDARAAASEQHGTSAKDRRMQRTEEHRAGMDHGKGCTHCDMTHGR